VRGGGRCWAGPRGFSPSLPGAAGDIAAPGQGAEKTATGGEEAEAEAAEAVAEAGFGVSLRSSSGGGGP
jgi:hypothetical protein